MSDATSGSIQAEAERLAAASPYGWGHTFRTDVLTIEGLLGTGYLDIAAAFDSYGFWPSDLTGHDVADVGCFSGGLSRLISERGARSVIAVDEVPEHLAQCRLVARAFQATSIKPLEASLYRLEEFVPAASLDLIVCSGVLYHLSDMLAGLVVMQRLLKPRGVLLLESNAVADFERSYANFGRFASGMWWQPTALCIADMCRFTGFETPDIRFYLAGRCVARAEKSAVPSVPFKRGMNCRFEDIHDERPRDADTRLMRPAR